MSIRTFLSKALAPATTELPQTDNRNEVGTAFFSSKRFLVLIAFGVLLVMNLLPTALLHDITLVVIAYMLGETVTKTATIWVNGKIKTSEVHTDIEYEKLDASKPKA